MQLTPKPKIDLIPEKEISTGDYRWFTYSPKDTGLLLICLENKKTGAVVTTTIANPEKRTASHKAWAGARQSRAAGMPWDILHEMGEKGVDPDQKLDEMFRGYGHASVGDMARLSVDMGRIPMHFCLAMFNEGSINSGQEKSTRYQPKFGSAILHNIKNYLPENMPQEVIEALEKEYQEFGTLSLELFAKYKERLTKKFTEYYQADMDNKGQKSALISRVLDCVRFFLLFGQWSGMSFETSARDWSRIIGDLKISPIDYYHSVAEELEKLLAPTQDEEKLLNFKAEAPSLIRHTEPHVVIKDNLQNLKEYIEEEADLLTKVPIQRGKPKKVFQQVLWIDSKYTEAERMVAQELIILYPGLNRKKLLEWVHVQTPKMKKKISNIIFANHSNHKELPNFTKTSRMTLIMKCFLGETRDLARHRAWGRFVALPSIFGLKWTKDMVDQILSQGYGLPLYLTDIPEFALIAKDFEKDLAGYYKNLADFINKVDNQSGKAIDFSFVINLLPLAHQTELWLHGDPKQALYMTFQRVRPGGHINYRALAYEANKLLASSDPYLSGLLFTAKPNPASREEFFDRS